jgi:hypothetical protein
LCLTSGILSILKILAVHLQLMASHVERGESAFGV